MEQSWLIWSNEHNGWWGPDRNGYTKSKKAAGRYTRADAVDICTGGNIALDDDQPPHEAMVQDA